MSDHFRRATQASIFGNVSGYDAITHHFSTYLKAHGYRDGTRLAYRSALSHFIRWLTTESPQEQTIDNVLVNAFLEQHLPVCHCLPPVFKEYKTVRAALNNLLVSLSEDRLSSSTAQIPPAIDSILREFDDFQLDVCGLSKSTRAYRQRFVRTLLVWLFDTSPVDSAQITPEALIRFVTGQAGNLKSSSIGVLMTALRSYLRFLQFKGESNVTLLAAVPKPPNWSLASLPPCLSDEEIGKFLAAFDISTPNGKRDYAIARCLMDLGLRCHEVAALQLEDIDWRQGVIELHHNKNRHEAQLPLPDTVGRAVVDYLRNGRPATTSRSLFVFHQAPFGRGVANTTVRGAIRRAFSRAGLPWTGTHILRHTMATKMVQNGVTLKEIADVLRHRDIDTTQIYTKVNLPELRQVAMPWPEGRR